MHVLDQHCILNIIKSVISCHHQHHYKCKILSCVSWDGGLKNWGYLDSVSHHYHSRHSTSSSSIPTQISPSSIGPCVRNWGDPRRWWYMDSVSLWVSIITNGHFSQTLLWCNFEFRIHIIYDDKHTKTSIVKHSSFISLLFK